MMAAMGDLLVRVLLLLPLASPSALLPELHQHIRGLVDRVDLLVDLVDIHSDLVGTGPFDTKENYLCSNLDSTQSVVVGAQVLVVKAGERKLRRGNLGGKPPGGSTLFFFTSLERTSSPSFTVAGLRYLWCQAPTLSIISAHLTSALAHNIFPASVLVENTRIGILQQICFRHKQSGRRRRARRNMLSWQRGQSNLQRAFMKETTQQVLLRLWGCPPRCLKARIDSPPSILSMILPEKVALD